MSVKSITEQLDVLIDELLLEGDIRSSSLASMLMAVRESAAVGYHVALARLVWDAHNALKADRLGEEEPAAEPPTAAAAVPIPVALPT